MSDLTHVLSDAEITALRAAYAPEQLLGANAGAFAGVYPPLAPWADSAAAVFFRNGPLAPRERELCLVTLLAHRAPGLSMSNHVYWALMEGCSVAQLCEAVGLAGCYGGLPTFSGGMLTIRRTLAVLKRVAAQPERDARAVLSALIGEFAGISL